MDIVEVGKGREKGAGEIVERIGETARNGERRNSTID
jgi:hypothetical protein